MAYHITFVCFYGYQKMLRYWTFLSKCSQHFIDLIDVITSKAVILRIMNLALMKFSLLPCGLKHTPFIFILNVNPFSHYILLYVSPVICVCSGKPITVGESGMIKAKRPEIM